MPSLEQRILNTRYLTGGMCVFLLLCIIGQISLFPLVLNYNYTEIYTGWYIFILCSTIFLFCLGIYFAIRIIKNTYNG